MNNEILHIIILAAAFLLLFASAELLYHKFHVRAEYTRKYVHSGTGLLTMLFPILLNNHWSVFILCFSFLVILLASLKFNYLPSINAIDRKSYGSIMYPIIVFICFLAWESMRNATLTNDTYIFFYLPILIMAFADPAATLIGKSKPMWIFKFGKEQKSFSGTSAFFVVAFILTLIFLFPAQQLPLAICILYAMLIALISAITELICGKGMDNFFIPVSVLLTLYVVLIVL